MMHSVFLHAQRRLQYQSEFLFWLLAIAVIACGIGLRGPWPGDEPRFAQVAREMVSSGHWFFPARGGELYADKPPVYMWIMALFYSVLGSIKWSFLLPNALSGLLTVFLVRDLGRRLWDARTGMIAGLMLLVTLQFVLRVRSAQIDAMECGWITLGCYGLLRHLLQPPQWRWYYVAWFCMGLGVITKGVGFLPALMLIPYGLARRWRPQQTEIHGGWRWWLGPLLLLLAIALWLVPMLIQVAHSQDPALEQYRDNIMFQQTARRYAHAWHHIKPAWFYLVTVIPLFWLPLSVLLPWLIPHWKAGFGNGDRRIILPLSWVVLLLIFFSVSNGKREVYVLPALPMLALVSAPYFDVLRTARMPGRILQALIALLTLAALVIACLGLRQHPAALRLIKQYPVEPWWLVLTIAAAGIIAVVAGRCRSWLTWLVFIPAFWILYGLWGYPLLQASQSADALFARVATLLPPGSELALVPLKEQLLLESPYPVTHFGFGAAVDEQLGSAWHWLDNANRFVLVNAALMGTAQRCFQPANTLKAGAALRKHWLLLTRQSRLDKCDLPWQAERIFRFQP